MMKKNLVLLGDSYCLFNLCLNQTHRDLRGTGIMYINLVYWHSKFPRAFCLAGAGWYVLPWKHLHQSIMHLLKLSRNHSDKSLAHGIICSTSTPWRAWLAGKSLGFSKDFPISHRSQRKIPRIFQGFCMASWEIHIIFQGFSQKVSHP